MNSKSLTHSASIAFLLISVSFLSGCSGGGSSAPAFQSTTDTPTTTPTTTTWDFTAPKKLVQSLSDNATQVDGAALTTVSVVYDELLSPFSTVSLKTAAGIDVSPAPKVTVFLSSLSYRPVAALSPGTSYIARFMARDSVGNKSTDVVIHFSTKGAAVDTQPPTITTAVPAANAREVSQTLKSFTITFSEAVNPLSVNNTAIKLSCSSSIFLSAVDYPLTLSLSADQLTATATYSQDLVNSATCKVDINGVKDLAALANTLVTSYQWRVAAATTPPAPIVWWPPAVVTAIGYKVTDPGTLPDGCLSEVDNCWRSSVADGTVKFVNSSAKDGTGRAMYFAYYKYPTSWYQITPAWYLTAVYADTGYLVEGDLFLLVPNSELDWVTGSESGAIAHQKSNDICVELYWDSVSKKMASRLLTCPTTL